MLKNYYSPTPKKLRKIGDAALATCIFLAGGGLLSYDIIKDIYTPKQIRISLAVILFVGAAAKFVTNLFGEPKDKA